MIGGLSRRKKDPQSEGQGGVKGRNVVLQVSLDWFVAHGEYLTVHSSWRFLVPASCEGMMINRF